MSIKLGDVTFHFLNCPYEKLSHVELIYEEVKPIRKLIVTRGYYM